MVKLVTHRITRNILNWSDGTHTLELEYRGSKKDLTQLLKDILETELCRE